MKSSTLEQDYWPGYLDALINVMLYLLLLVGSFALGMVALTLHSMKQQQQLSFLGASDSAQGATTLQGGASQIVGQMKGRASQIVDQMNLTEAEKSLISVRLGQIDAEAMVRRREELDRQLQLEQLREAQRQQAKRLVVEEAETAAEPSLLTGKRAQEANFDHLKAQLTRVDEEYQNALQVLDRERRLSLQQRESSSPAAKANEVIFDLRVAAKPSSTVSLGPRETQAKLFDRDPKVIWEFESSRFLWDADKPVPAALADVDVAAAWQLVIFADMENSRVMRESFARVNSVREVLVRQGFTRKQIKVEIRSLHVAPTKDERVLRTVFMLAGV
jgi:hypothetical protein